MENLLIESKIREEHGSANTRRLRRAGFIPGNIYGHGVSYNVSVNSHDFEMLRHKMHSEHAMIKIKVEEKELDVLIKDVQRDQVAHNVIHLDFLVVDLDEVVRISVQVETTGEADGVKNHAGVLELIRREVEVECKANDIPSAISVDVSPLGIHDVIRIEDLPDISGITYCDDPKLTVITIAPPTVHAEEVKEEVEEEEGAEPEVIGEKEKEQEQEKPKEN